MKKFFFIIFIILIIIAMWLFPDNCYTQKCICKYNPHWLVDERNKYWSVEEELTLGQEYKVTFFNNYTGNLADDEIVNIEKIF